MTTGEKAKAYDEGIRQMKAMKKSWETLSYNGKTFLQDLEHIFPELAETESEDEKIRKWTINYLENRILNSSNIDEKEACRNAIAWLEKQGEQKPAWSEGDELKRSTLIHVVKKQQGSAIFQGLLPEELIDWLESLKDRCIPQPKAEWNAKDKGLIDLALWCVNQKEASYDGEAFSQKDFVDAKNWLNSLKDRVLPQPKQEWSEEDEHCIRGIRYYLGAAKVGADPCGQEELERYISWLKSLRPQPKQEWSKEDIDMIDWLIRCCEREHSDLCNDRYGHQEIVSDLKRDCRKKWDWLESLKEKVAPQKQWKPSEHQLEALKKASRNEYLKTEQYDTLVILYEELKALYL